MRNASALHLRNIGIRVRQTASLISGHNKIRERQGALWAANMDERIIYWRATHPFKPDEYLSDDQVLFLTIHEAAHLEISGGFDCPEPPVVDDKVRFHRFWNAVEDIRIEKWAKMKFPGVEHLCRELHVEFHDLMLGTFKDKKNPGIHIADQVGLNYLNRAEGLEAWGEKRCRKFVDKTWPQIENIVNTSKSSSEVSDRILPIYKELMDLFTEEEKKASGEDEGDVIFVDMDGDGFSRSTDSEGGKGKVLSFKELLEGIAQDADDGETKRRITVVIKSQEAAEEIAEQLAQAGIGSEASGFEDNTSDWAQSAAHNRGPINVLARRLETKLAHNAADRWDVRLKRGKLHSRNAHRSMRGDMKVFRKKDVVGKCDYDFCITIDVSGSQSGRAQELLAATVIFAEAIERASMGLSIITWDAEMRHWKNWYTPLKSAQGIIGADLAHPGGGTYEAQALRVAEDLIRHRLMLERSVFLITITDGQTASPEESREIIHSLEARGVKTIGIGVQCPAPSHYDVKLSAQSGEELGLILPNLLSQIVKRG